MVDSQHEHCPLCGSQLDNSGDSITRYPPYKPNLYSMRSITLPKLSLFFSITTCIILIAVNMLTLEVNPQLWSIVPMLCVLTSVATYRNFFVLEAHMGGKILIQFFLTSVFLILLDVFTGFKHWSTNYALPFLSILSTASIMIIAIVRKALYTEYTGYLFIAIIDSVIPLILILTPLETKAWPGVVAVLYSLIVVIGLLIFSDSQFKTELKKRFIY
jgi:hypothetical protein